MAVTLIGEIVNSCDAVTGFNVGNISTDDDFVEGTGAIGLKASLGLNEMYTTTLGATAPYDFSSAGSEFGWHIILWLNTKTPIDTTTGLRIVVGNGTDRGNWDVIGTGFYKGGFTTRVVNTARNFNTITAGSWATGSNPGQLTNVTQIGGAFTTLTTIMGNFNNIQVDQITIGLGLRADGGTVGSPNTFATVQGSDENGTKYGWWGSSNGAYVGKGRLYIGPSTGNATCVFTDSAFRVVFADEAVASDFYEFNIRGTGTIVNWTLGTIASAAPSNSRWAFSADTVGISSFSDTNSVWSGSRLITFNSNCGCTGTTFIDATSIVQASATFNGCSFLDANITSSSAVLTSNNLALITNCTFESNGVGGHAIQLTSTGATGSYTFSNNSFVGYASSDGSTGNEAIYNNSGGAVIINVADGGDTPSIRNGTGASTTVNNSVILTLTNLVEDTEVRIYTNGTTTELAGNESVTGGTFEYAYNYTPSTYIDVVIFKEDYIFNEPDGRIKELLLSATNSSIPINQQFDRNYLNP